jgi:hypothetical protein
MSGITKMSSRSGRLKVLLPDYKTQSWVRQIRKMTPKLRAFIDFIAATYG